MSFFSFGRQRTNFRWQIFLNQTMSLFKRQLIKQADCISFLCQIPKIRISSGIISSISTSTLLIRTSAANTLNFRIFLNCTTPTTTLINILIGLCLIIGIIKRPLPSLLQTHRFRATFHNFLMQIVITRQLFSLQTVFIIVKVIVVL